LPLAIQETQLLWPPLPSQIADGKEQDAGTETLLIQKAKLNLAFLISSQLRTSTSQTRPLSVSLGQYLIFQSFDWVHIRILASEAAMR
jgi:hypothetical protein